MEVKRFIGKEKDVVLEEALKSLNLTVDDVVITTEEKKMGLFKGIQFEVSITPLTEIVDYVKGYLEGILVSMGLEATFETKIREKQITIKMFSNDNPILIGHGGKNLSALQTVVRQAVKSKLGVTPYITLDVENYKDKQIMHLEKMAKRIAKEVLKTKVEVELENMNSYERLVVHNAIANFKDVYSESTGEEPNRHVVIKPKKD